MPQLVPFYYINEVFFTFILIVVILYILSKYILPRIVNLFISRMFIQNNYKYIGKPNYAWYTITLKYYYIKNNIKILDYFKADN